MQPVQTRPVNSENFQLRNWLVKYLHYGWLFAGVILIGMAAAAYYLKKSKAQYRISASIAIQDEKKGESTQSSLNQLGLLEEQRIVDNESEIIRSAGNLLSVVNKLSLHVVINPVKNWFSPATALDEAIAIELLETPAITDPLSFEIRLIDSNRFVLQSEKQEKEYRYSDTIITQGLQFRLHKVARQPKQYPAVFQVAIHTPEEIAQELRAGISLTSPGKNSSVLHISLLYPNPEKGKSVLEAILQAYEQNNIRSRQLQSDTLLRLIEHRLVSIAGQLKDFEGNTAAYKQKGRITQLSDDSRMFLEKVRETDRVLAEAQVEYDLLNAIDMAAAANHFDAPVSGSLSDPVLTGLFESLSRLELEKEQLERTTGEQNFQLQANTKQLEKIRTAIRQNIGTHKARLLQTIRSLERTRALVDRSISQIPANEKQLTELLRETNIRERIYSFLLEKHEEAALAQAAALTQMRIIDLPYSTVQPVKPSRVIVLAAAFLFAFLLASLLAHLHYLLRNRLAYRSDILIRTHKTPFAELPALPKGFLYSPLHESAGFSEYALVSQSLSILPRQLVLLSGPSYQEKTSQTAFNLAITAAAAGKKTLLLHIGDDIDQLSELSGCMVKGSFADLLEQPEKAIADQTQALPAHPHLYLLLPQRGQLNLGRQEALMTLLELVRLQYDLVLVHLPGYLQSPLAQLAAQYCDSTFLLLQHKRTRLSVLEKLGQLPYNLGQLEWEVLYDRLPISYFTR